MLSKFTGVYIASIDCKDLYISNNYIDDNSRSGYSLYTKNGELNLKKFINTLDYSIELIKLRETYRNVFRKKSGFSKQVKDKEYCHHIINVTFNYSNKDWNTYGENLYVKFGYNARKLKLENCACVIDGVLVAIETNKKVSENILSNSLLGKYFRFDPESSEYKQDKNFKTLNTVADLRKNIYSDGFYCDGIKYVRFKRSSGSARVGKCLFINESLYNEMHRWELCGLNVSDGDEIDLAAFESYISLTSSSIIDVVNIKKENILIIDDRESVFCEDSIVTEIKDKKLYTSQKNIEIQNSLWDGQSIADVSLFGNYKHYGMILLRNRFFKSACFNCNLQKWFQDNNIVSVDQLNGFTIAKNISDIKLITTPSSIKYLKFGTREDWINNLDENFGLVKHEKDTKYFDGRMVQMHYQLLNSLQLSYQEVEDLVKPDLKYIDLVKSVPEVLRYHLKYPENRELFKEELKTKNEIIYNLLGLNSRFYQTNLCRNFIRDMVKAYYTNLRCGHLTISGTYATLFGNPMEMLKESIGIFDGESDIEKNTCVCSFYEDGEIIVGSRSPHISFSNVLVSKIRNNINIDKYFNLTDEIICINSIGENILNKLSGSDYDSDSLLITNNSIIVNAALKNDGKFMVPFNGVGAKKINRKYTPEQKADLDIKTSVNLIGEIINMSQELNSLYWDRIYNGYSHEDNIDLYLDICQLDIMSRIEIDSAKKEFDINNKRELKALKSKYHIGDFKRPLFFKMLSDIKKFDSSNKEFKEYETPMDYLQKCIAKFRLSKFKGKPLKFHEILKFESTNNYNKRHVSQIKSIVNECNYYIRDMWANNDKLDGYQKYLFCLDKKQEMTDRINALHISKATIIHILKSIDDNNYRYISQLLLSILFNYKNKEFYEILIDSMDANDVIYEDENGDVDIFGFKFSAKNA